MWKRRNEQLTEAGERTDNQMKKILSLCGTALSVLFLCAGISRADSARIVYDNYMPIPNGAAYSSTFSVRTDGINRASVQVVLTSVTTVSPTFNDGRSSTATFTVVSYTALSTAPAHGTLTIISTAGVAGSCVSGGGPGVGSFNVCEPTNWKYDAVAATQSACNLAAAINRFNIVTSTCAGAVVFATAPYNGSIFNSFNLNSSTPAALSTSSFSGGQDNQYLMINGVKLLANTDFYPVTSTAQTATNIAAAISAKYSTIGATATAASNVVYATTTVVGANTNYAIFSSSQGALTISPYTSSGPVTATGAMYGGFNSSYTLNASVISIPNHGLGLAEGVWFSGASLSPLSVNTTYYAIPNGLNSLQLALTSTGAVAGVPIVFLSSAVPTTTDTFTLNVPAIAGTPSIAWAASNDGVNWLPYTLTSGNIAVPSVSYSSYFSTGTVNNFDFGYFNYGYLGLSVTAPTAGAVTIKARLVGKE